MQARLLKIGQAAELIGVPVTTLRDWCKAKKIDPLVAPSGHRFFTHSMISKIKANMKEGYDAKQSQPVCG